jgi:hypothetical protein
MIVKVQRPLFPPDAPWLVYDQRRTFHVTMQPTAELLDMMGSDDKAWFRADRPKGNSGQATIRILERVADQPW